MLDADIDDDYFTPFPSTSLASIFTNKQDYHHNEDCNTNSLKYTPTKPQNVAKPTVESKVTDCLLACALFAYEWLGDSYIAKGNIGLAIIRNTKNNNHDIILYDSNKRTLSCAAAKSNLEVTVKDGHYVSYHDNLKKYWTLYATEEEVTKIANLLKSFSIQIKYFSHSVEGPPVPKKLENIETEIQKAVLDSKESDTDSSINTKTKISILNRMASMGQSILPKVISSGKTSDSSDNENFQSKTTKHKLTKGTGKKMLDKPHSAPGKHATSETAFQTLLPQSLINAPFYTFSTNGQLLPLNKNNTPIRHDNGTQINTLMSEQRICNSELRINMGRLTDKMDQMLDRIKGLENSKHSNNTPCNVEVDLYKKLVNEYEFKIKMYEDILQKNNSHCTERNIELIKEKQNNKINEQPALQSTIEDKNKEISLLKKEKVDIKSQQDELISTNIKNVNDLREELANLKKDLASKEEMLSNISKTKLSNNPENSSNTEQKLKYVMNETFQTISSHFESDVTYSGSTVKSIIAAIIKKVTLDSIKE